MAAVQRFWDFLNTDIKELVSLDTMDGSVDTAAEVFKLAETLQDEDIQDLAGWVEKSGSLLDVLTTPEAELIESVLPFAKIATGLLKFYILKTKKQITYPQSVILVCLSAYTESLKEFTVGIQVSRRAAKHKLEKPQSWKDFELTEAEANQVLVCFRTSKLAEDLRQLIVQHFQQLGVETERAILITERAVWQTHRYITKAWSQLPTEARSFLGGASVAEWAEEQRKYQSIDTYLQEFISPNPSNSMRKVQWQVFNEPFTFKELYVPLRAQPLDGNGEVAKYSKSIGLETWAKQLLNDYNKQNQILFVQAGPGRGKSVFCRIFADWVRENWYPIWIPILIRLRDLPKLQDRIEDTLKSALSTDFAENDNGWLTDRNTRFLFLLDGFDELLMEGRTTGGLELFLDQVGKFQERCTSPEMGHRVIVTGRPLALHGVERLLPNNLERVKILPMGKLEQEQWLTQWQKLVAVDKAQQFREFLQNDQCPTRIKGSGDETGLAQEPLLLYLLAAMHRDDELNLETFAGADSTQAKVLIYQKTLDWVLTKQRPDWLNRDLTEMETEGLRRILAEAGLCVIQSGGECAAIQMIEDRLKTDDEARTLLEEAQERLNENPLRNALAAFYLQAGRKGSGSVEFAHKSFSEFLCAERIKEALLDWSQLGGRRGNLYLVSDQELFWEIYDLFGTPILTPEIVEYLIVLLTSSDEYQPVQLFERLHDFYLCWCEGEFIDAEERNLPQEKMRTLRKQNIQTGLRQVDVYAGLNVMILLFKLHANAWQDYDPKDRTVPKPEIEFFPCGIPDTDMFQEDKLLNQIHYADALGAFTFTKIIGPHLAYANLARTDLDSVNFSYANLSYANLSNAILPNANLYEANLISANLHEANLISANLYEANLISANLYEANLTRTNFSRANLTNANLSEANLNSADLSEADLNSADLSEANLDSADFGHAKLMRTNFNRSNLTHANFTGACLIRTNLSYTNLSYTNFDSANLSRANLSRANLSRANLDSTNFYCANLDGANLSYANFVGTNLYCANLPRAYIDRVNLVNVDLSRANINGAIIKNSDFNIEAD